MPSNGAVITQATAQFAWRRSTDADPFDTLSYRLQYATNPGFTGAVTLARQADTTAQSPDTLAQGIPYYWRVFCIDQRSADSVASATFSFTRGGGGLAGDINVDGRVTASDVIFAVNYVFKGGAPPALPWTADVNADCRITASDIIYLVNFVFKGGTAPQVGCA
jgi:hypothetical protein